MYLQKRNVSPRRARHLKVWSVTMLVLFLAITAFTLFPADEAQSFLVSEAWAGETHTYSLKLCWGDKCITVSHTVTHNHSGSGSGSNDISGGTGSMQPAPPETDPTGQTVYH